MERNRIIDLSIEIQEGMRIHPKHPPVEITLVDTIEKDGWELRYVSMGTHTGTHVDVPAHMINDGKNLSDIPIEKFFGRAIRAHVEDQLPKNIGLVFGENAITKLVAEKIIEANAPFIATDDICVIQIEAKAILLKANIILFNKLVNTDQIPKGVEFTFYGLPLNIVDGDGSPIRAIAIFDKH